MLKPDDVRSGESPGNTVNILVVINRLKGKPLLVASCEAMLKGEKKERKTDPFKRPLWNLQPEFGNLELINSVMNLYLIFLRLYTVFTN